jgi:SOS-response transcriptional repressor LexA
MTKLQALIYAFVRNFIEEHGYSPSCAEVARACGTWPGTANVNLKELAKRGYLIKGHGWRNIRLPDGHNARAA